MKILFITNLPSPYRVLFFSELGRLCDLTVIYERMTASDRNIDWKEKKENTYKEIYLNGINIGNDGAWCPGILSYLNKDYDIIVMGVYHTPTAMMAISYLKWKKIPFVISTDGGFVSEEGKVKKRLKTSFIGSASGWLSPSKGGDEYLTYYGADKDHIYRYNFTSLLQNDLHYGRDLSKKKEQFRKKNNITEKIVVISVGRFSYNGGFGKGYDTLLKAAQYINPNIGIYIVGDEPTPEFKKMKLKMHLDNVHFVGFKKKKELAEYYAASDIFVLMTRGDVWGLVINEAMSYGIPIITTYQCLAGQELVKNDDTGYLLDCEDYSRLAEYISLLSENDELRNKMSCNCFGTIEKYTIEEMAKEHFEYFNAFINYKKERNNQ